ncbi:hypothetical protein NE683_14085 [Bariatricus massiliensis]|uniref:Uncharacterized protein n=1 Tax=Bariatricus massiliensis TaxID=1745713 RepID=A0ABS8DLT3_9FIRM|nr:hypothetical protein [Bariatricus massiliensis]MCB7306114.1 hypothetical protein [Bariatricus massiliensis]MCB7376677.1 hypothetical protein [Bariatricus massiliensis]MCB7389335.1 hypothetical protein [Bariatricus massiliensis]MCB7413478.1 hypothetical protein [Bariatricus massiliensis]MCQ5254351.1 hypothetical protein [Bariatricus massiliensis]
MATEKTIHQYLKEAGFEPVENKAIIVKYAPSDTLSEKLASFFSTEYYVLQMCKSELVLIPVRAMSTTLKKDIALQLSYSSIHSVEVKAEKTNYAIAIMTDTDTIHLLSQKKELSEFRSSGTLATGQSFLNIGAMGTMLTKPLNWHRENIDDTLQMLQSL